MITLYDHPLSPYAQKVKIALREKGLAYEAPMPGGLGAGGAQGPFVEASPRAEVPALVDGTSASSIPPSSWSTWTTPIPSPPCAPPRPPTAPACGCWRK